MEKKLHQQLLNFSKNLRVKILTMSNRCNNSSHIGGALSSCEVFSYLFAYYLNFNSKNKNAKNRDKFILSKGHGVLTYYATLNEIGIISDNQINTFQHNGSDLIAHPVYNPEIGIESSNGSLGQGLSFSLGLAHASKLKSINNKIVTIIGDGECNEGIIWEAAMLGPQLRLDNLLVIIDNNNFQNDGPGNEILNQNNLEERWKSFGWDTHSCDGHDLLKIDDSIRKLNQSDNKKPKLLVANTIKGKGVSFMENNNDWHHNRLTEKNFLLAIDEINND